MKAIIRIFVLFSLLLPLLLNAQFQKNHAAYLGLDFTLDKPLGGGFSLNYIYKQQYSLQVKSGNIFKESNAIPHDFQQSCIMSNGNCDPPIVIQTKEFLIGKIINIKESNGALRLNLKVGVSLNKFQTPTNFEKKNCNSGGLFGCLNLFGANYSYDMKKEQNIGFLINPVLEIPFWQGLGIAFSPYININNYQVLFGGQVGVMLGLLRPRKTKKPKL